MSNHDLENLDFLLNASEEVLKDWYEQASSDDIEYAAELLDHYEHSLYGVTHSVVNTIQ